MLYSSTKSMWFFYTLLYPYPSVGEVYARSPVATVSRPQEAVQRL
jgi:hypothetical protein